VANPCQPPRAQWSPSSAPFDWHHMSPRGPLPFISRHDRAPAIKAQASALAPFPTPPPHCGLTAPFRGEMKGEVGKGQGPNTIAKVTEVKDTAPDGRIHNLLGTAWPHIALAPPRHCLAIQPPRAQGEVPFCRSLHLCSPPFGQQHRRGANAPEVDKARPLDLHTACT
jgi:hypothetical protein